MVERIRNLMKSGNLTFVFVLAMYAFVIVAVIIFMAGCGAIGVSEPARTAAADEPTTDKPKADEPAEPEAAETPALRDSFTITIDSKEALPERSLIATEDLGSHVMYVTVPEVKNADLAEMMDAYNMGIIEVYFRRDEGDRLPDCSAEPEASAVFYIYEKTADADGIKISWERPSAEDILETGLHLDEPSFVMKYMMICSHEDPAEIRSLIVEDYTGSVLFFDDVKGASFAVDSLDLPFDALRDSMDEDGEDSIFTI